MTNKPMLSVERELLSNLSYAIAANDMHACVSIGKELRALLDAQHVVCSNGILCQNSKCAECGGSGKAPVEQFSGDTVVCRRYQLEQHPGQNFYHYDLEPVYGSVPVTVSDLITMVESAPVAVVLPDRLKTEPFTTIDRGSKNYKAGYNAAIAEVAKLNGLKP